MSGIGALWHIYPENPEPVSLAKWSRPAARAAWLCGGCGSPTRNVNDFTVYVQNHPEDVMSFISGTSIQVARRSFLSVLGEERVGRDLYMGRVCASTGGVLEDWVTIGGRRRVAIRGTDEAAVRICDQCGCTLYYATGDRYLYPDPPRDVEVLEACLYGLVVREPVAVCMRVPEARGLVIERMRVAAMPADGLGEIAGEV